MKDIKCDNKTNIGLDYVFVYPLCIDKECQISNYWIL